MIFYDRSRDSTNILLLFPRISLKSIAKAENLRLLITERTTTILIKHETLLSHILTKVKHETFASHKLTKT